MQNSKADYAMEAILYVIRYWRKVYFSSAIQWEQKSPSPLLPDSASNVVQKFCALEWGVSWMAGLHAPTGWGWPDELHPTDPAHAAETGMGCRGRTEPSNPNQDRSGTATSSWDAHRFPVRWNPSKGYSPQSEQLSLDKSICERSRDMEKKHEKWDSKTANIWRK